MSNSVDALNAAPLFENLERLFVIDGCTLSATRRLYARHLLDRVIVQQIVRVLSCLEASDRVGRQCAQF
jgi:hypothetical protein